MKTDPDQNTGLFVLVGLLGILAAILLGFLIAPATVDRLESFFTGWQGATSAACFSAVAAMTFWYDITTPRVGSAWKRMVIGVGAAWGALLLSAVTVGFVVGAEGTADGDHRAKHAWWSVGLILLTSSISGVIGVRRGRNRA